MERQIFFIVIVMSAVDFATGITCIKCSQTHFTGDPNFDDCYKLQSLSVMEDTNCHMNEPDAYCYTKIELSDGMLSYLERGCANPRHDALYTTDEVPDSVKCTTSYGNAQESQSIHQTECYLACEGDVCNVMKILDQLKSCPDGCLGNTECNYFTGKCQCAPNRHGEDCLSNDLSANSHSCVQCNSQMHPNCSSMTTGAKCQNGEKHCSTTQTWILNQDGTFDSDAVVTRSCSSQYVSPDRCYLTGTSDINIAMYTEYTCVSTCSEENCNTGIANGNVDEEFIPVKCVVCEGDEKSCGPSYSLTTDCPRDTTHCMSSVTYWETVVHDSNLAGVSKPEPSISIRSINRGCSNVPVKKSCSKKRIGLLNVHKVTCSESCIGDGCNTGWPARPKCVKCDNKKTKSQGHKCLHTPPSSQNCAGPHHEYCYAYLQRDGSDSAAASSDDSEEFLIVRGCSSYDEKSGSEACRNVTDYGRVIGTECIDYCRENGCNYHNFEHDGHPEIQEPTPANLRGDIGVTNQATSSTGSVVALFAYACALMFLEGF